VTLPSPLLQFFRDAGGVLMHYGPSDMSHACDVVAALAPIEFEYATLRKYAALLDQPTRGVLELKGPDRLDFLNRMVTQELKDLQPGVCRRSFWLSRKGRIDADMRVLHLEDRTLLDLDVLAVSRACAGLASFIITEDCSIADATSTTHRLSLHGPASARLLALCSQSNDITSLAQDHALTLTIAGAQVIVLRDDSAGVPGYELFVPATTAVAVTQDLVSKGHDAQRHDAPERAIALLQRDDPAAAIRLQLIGWHAYNIARMEAGTPLYNIDFGPESLPAETGVLHDRVSFKKGCYLGQEVVARMHARGQSKQQLVAIKFERRELPTQPGNDEHSAYPPVPDPGSAVALEGTADAAGEVIGTITSATPSPQLAMAPIAFAQVRSGFAKAGTIVVAHAEGSVLRGVMQPELRVHAKMIAGRA
jgi:tRNA-modifying protein YgfZ